MTKLFTASIAAFALVACSDAETSDQPTAPGTEAAPTRDEATPLGTAGARCPEEGKPPVERKTPTTFEACEGYWDCGPYVDKDWIRPAGDACLMGAPGSETKLFADGSVSDARFEATWTGDAFYVTFHYPPGEDGKPRESSTCKRLPNEPSK